MNDMSSVIVPKSDQINADDLLAGPKTITIRDVQIKGGQEQPVSIFFEGSDKAFRPCKSMSRVLVAAWGADAKNYIGRSLTLYRDPEVKWGGLAVGGIRISHMSHIDGTKQLMLTATKGSRKPFKVMPLKDAPVSQQTDAFGLAPVTEGPAKARQTPEEWTNGYLASVRDCDTIESLMELQSKSAKALAKLQTDKPDLHELTVNAGTKRAAELQEMAE